MHKDILTFRQAQFLIIMFIFGSSVVMGVNSEAGQDSWLSVIIAVVLVFPVLMMYARIIKLHPGKGLFEIIETLFGKVSGKIITALMTWYALHLGALVLRNFSEFIQITAMPETPQLPIMIAMLLVTLYLAKSGIATLGKWGIVILPIVIIILLLTIILALKHMDFTNIMPIMEHSPGKITAGALQLFTFPYAETILFLAVAHTLKKGVNPYKLFAYSSGIAAIVLVLVVLRNIETLGVAMVEAEYFPSYVTARIIHYGDFLARIEGSISMNFILAGITKITLCLMATAKGMAKLLGFEDYKQILMPTGLLVLALCAIIYNSTMEMFEFLKYYQIYAIPFQIMIPFIIWITGEIQAKRNPQR